MLPELNRMVLAYLIRFLQVMAQLFFYPQLFSFYEFSIRNNVNPELIHLGYFADAMVHLYD